MWFCGPDLTVSNYYCTPLYVSTDKAGPNQLARMVVYADGTFLFQVLFVTPKTGVWKDTPSQDDMNMCLDTLLSNAGYLLCPGIENS